MDSKMESMRAQIDNDRQLEGVFTSYNPALERASLKKEKYLHPQAPAPAGTPAQAPSAPVAKPPAPPVPDRVPAQTAHPLFSSGSSSFFGDKLKQALKPGEPRQGS
jgi:hypothetical protein